MTYSNSCLIIVNNILREYVDNFPHYLSQGFEKLSEILPNIIPTIKNCSNIDWNNQQNKIDFTDEETNTILQILIQPTYKDLKDTIKILTDSENIKERYIVYVGSHGASYSSNWLLEDGIFSANSMLTTLSETLWIENNSPDSSSISILTPSNSAHWNKILSTLKNKETKQDRVRVFAFSSEIKVGEESAFNKDIEEFCQILYKKYQPILLNDDIINSSQNIGILQLMNKNGSFYVFDEGCGQSNLLALNGFNLVIDGGYKRTPEFWNFLQKIEKIDTYMMTSWNETNLFGMESLLDFKSKSAENSDDLSRPNLNYCVLPIGPNPHKEKEKLEIKSHLEINIEMESQRILNQIKSLEIPLLQMSRDAKSMSSPHQLYFKLGQGCLDAFPLWPCSAETSGDSKRYVDEWQKESKVQSIYFDELVKDNASAFLLIWNGSKVTVESPTEEANMLTRILISSSCHESNLLKSLEEFSKVNPICNSLSGKPSEKKTVEKKPISADVNKKSTVPVKDSLKSMADKANSDLTKKSTVPAKDSLKSMTDKANAAKKPASSTDKNKEINKGDIQNKSAEKKLLPSTDKSTKGKSNDKKDEKKDDIIAPKLNEKKILPSKAPLVSQPAKKINDKTVDLSDSKKPIKKSSPTDKVSETNEAKKPIKKPLTAENDDTKKNVKKPLTAEKVTEAGDGKKPLKKPVVTEKLAESVDTKKVSKKITVTDKSADSAEVKKLIKKPLSNEKPIETQDTKKPKKPLSADKGSEADAKKPIKKVTPNEKTGEIDSKKAEKKTVKDETIDPKKLPKRPMSEKISEKPNLNKKSTTGKSEIETKKVKDSKSLSQHKIVKKADVKSPEIKKDDKLIADVTVNKNDLESDLEKIEVVGQPSISLNTDDTLNNIDTSELLGKMEVIGPNSNHIEDEQLLITAERYDLQSTPLSDMITDSPEHPKTEEDVEALKTDALSIDQDLLINNEEFPEDDKVGASVNDEFIEECENKAPEEVEHPNISDEVPVIEHIDDSNSKDLNQEFVLESQNLKDYGIYEDGEYDEEHKVEAGEDLQEIHEFVKESEIESQESKDVNQEPTELHEVSEIIEENQAVKEELSLDLHYNEDEKEVEKLNTFDDSQDVDHMENDVIIEGLTDNQDENQVKLDNAENIEHEYLYELENINKFEKIEIENEKSANLDYLQDEIENKMDETQGDKNQEMSYQVESDDEPQNVHHTNEIENQKSESHLYDDENEPENVNRILNKSDSEEEIQMEISFEKENRLKDMLENDVLKEDDNNIEENTNENSETFGNDDVQEEQISQEIKEHKEEQNDIDYSNINFEDLIDDSKFDVEVNEIDELKENENFEKEIIENDFEKEILPQSEHALQEAHFPENRNENQEGEFDNQIEDIHEKGVLGDNKYDSEGELDYQTTKNIENSNHEEVQKGEDSSEKNIQDENNDFENETGIEMPENVMGKTGVQDYNDLVNLNDEVGNLENIHYNEYNADDNVKSENKFETHETVENLLLEKYDSENEHESEIEQNNKNVHINEDIVEDVKFESKIDNDEEENLYDKSESEEHKPQSEEDIEEAYYEKELDNDIDNHDKVEDFQENEKYDSQEEHDPQTAMDIENTYHEKDIINEADIPEHAEDYPVKEIEETHDSEDQVPQATEDLIDEINIPEHFTDYPEKEIEEKYDTEENDPQVTENIEDKYCEKDFMEETSMPEHTKDYPVKESEEIYDSEEHDLQTTDDIENMGHENETEIHKDVEDYSEKEIEERYNSEENEPHVMENNEDRHSKKDFIDETSILEHAEDYPVKEIEEIHDFEEHDLPTTEDIENIAHENDIINETEIHKDIEDDSEKEIEETHDSEEEHDPEATEIIESKDVIDETSNTEHAADFIEKKFEENYDSDENDPQVTENIEDTHYAKDIINETDFPDFTEKEIEETHDSEEEHDLQATEIEERDVIDKTSFTEYVTDYPEKEIDEKYESEEEHDLQVTEKDIIHETNILEHAEQYPENVIEEKYVFDDDLEGMGKTHYTDNIKSDDESHEKFDDYPEQVYEDQNLDSRTKEHSDIMHTDIVNDDAHIDDEIGEEHEKENQNKYDLESQFEISNNENIHHDTDFYDKTDTHEVEVAKEVQDEKYNNENEFEHFKDISHNYDSELPNLTAEHEENLENISESNVQKDESGYQDDEIIPETQNMEEAKNFEDDEENDDGEMIIHDDVASNGEMDHINESDENEDLYENQNQSDNGSEVNQEKEANVENDQNQSYLDEPENENDYKHEIDEKTFDQVNEDLQNDDNGDNLDKSVNEKIFEDNSYEDVIEGRNNDPDDFDNDIEVSNEQENKQEVDDNIENFQGDNDDAEHLTFDSQNITERPDSLVMDNHSVNEDLINIQGDSASSENHQETDRIMPDSESNDSDLSVDLVKDHTTDSSKDSEQDTYVPSMPILDDIIEDTSPSSPLPHEASEFDRDEIEHNVNEVDNSQFENEVNMNDVNITPDILRGLKSLNLSEPTEVEVEQVVEDEEIIKYQTSIHDSDKVLKPDITDQFQKNTDSVELSDKESEESDESANIQSPIENANDDYINMSCKLDHDNLIGSVNGNHHYEHFPESDSISNTHWNEPLGLPMPTLLSTKATAKPTPEKISSHTSAKLKSANAAPVKLNGTSSNTVSAMAHKSTETPKATSSPRNSIPPKPSAPKSAPISKAPASKPTKKTEIVDPSKLTAFYMEIAYIPVDHDGNVNPTRVSEAFFTRIRARQYILPGLEHSSDVLDMILAARRKWSEEDNEMEVRVTPVKMTETLKKWAGQHAQELSQLNIKIGAAVEHCSVNLGGDNNMPCIAHRIDF